MAPDYTKYSKSTCTNLAIGVDRNNSMVDMHNAKAHNTTQKILVASDRPRYLDKPNTKPG